jgi:hypothetical protein
MLNTYLQNPPRKYKITDYEFENSSNQNSNHDQAEVIALAIILPLQLRTYLHIFYSLFSFISTASQNNFKISAQIIRLKNYSAHMKQVENQDTNNIATPYNLFTCHSICLFRAPNIHTLYRNRSTHELQLAATPLLRALTSSPTSSAAAAIKGRSRAAT